MKVVNWIALLLVVIGALNWGMLGFFQLDVVELFFGDMTRNSRIVYGIVGIAGLYSLTFFTLVGGQPATKSR